jgi:hypothetical protein
MRLIEQEIPIRQDECGQINPPGDFQRCVEHGAEMAPPRAACDNVGLRGRVRSGRRAAGAGTDVEVRGDGAYQLVLLRYKRAQAPWLLGLQATSLTCPKRESTGQIWVL